MAKWIEKQYQTIPLGAVVEDSMVSGSKINAPSINAVKNAFSNPNLLINGDFQVWQRGTSDSGNNSNSPFYVADRWQAYSSTNATYTANSKNSDGSMNIAVDGNDTCTFKQILENPLPSGEYTISFEVISLTGTIKLYYIDNGSNKYALDVVQGINTVTISTTTLKEISFYLYGTSNLQLKYIKLEQGSIATPFVPRLYAEELAMCKRYFIKYHEESMHSAVSANTQIFLSIQNSFRIKPTLKLTSINCYIPVTDAYPTITSGVVVYTYSKTNNTILSVSNSALGNGQVIFPFACYFELDAEIY